MSNNIDDLKLAYCKISSNWHNTFGKAQQVGNPSGAPERLYLYFRMFAGWREGYVTRIEEDSVEIRNGVHREAFNLDDCMIIALSPAPNAGEKIDGQVYRGKNNIDNDLIEFFRMKLHEILS